MDFRPVLTVVALLAVTLFASPAFAQVDFSEFAVDGQLTQEQMEIMQKMEGVSRHKGNFMEDYVSTRLEEKFPDPMEADVSEMREEMERLREEADEAYAQEHPERAEELDGYIEELKAIAARERGGSEEGTDSDQDLSDIFDDVDGQIAVYGRQGRKVTGNDGFILFQDDGYLVEFCYADTGCEDQSDIEGRMSAGMGEMHIHRSDADKEVVGLRLHIKVHHGSASLATVFVATGHTSDELGNPFEIEDTLFESDTYEPGDTITYDLGNTD